MNYITKLFLSTALLTTPLLGFAHTWELPKDAVVISGASDRGTFDFSQLQTPSVRNFTFNDGLQIEFKPYTKAAINRAKLTTLDANVLALSPEELKPVAEAMHALGGRKKTLEENIRPALDATTGQVIWTVNFKPLAFQNGVRQQKLSDTAINYFGAHQEELKNRFQFKDFAGNAFWPTRGEPLPDNYTLRLIPYLPISPQG